MNRKGQVSNSRIWCTETGLEDTDIRMDSFLKAWERASLGCESTTFREGTDSFAKGVRKHCETDSPPSSIILTFSLSSSAKGSAASM